MRVELERTSELVRRFGVLLRSDQSLAERLACECPVRAISDGPAQVLEGLAAARESAEFVVDVGIVRGQFVRATECSECFGVPARLRVQAAESQMRLRVSLVGCDRPPIGGFRLARRASQAMRVAQREQCFEVVRRPFEGRFQLFDGARAAIPDQKPTCFANAAEHFASGRSRDGTALRASLTPVAFRECDSRHFVECRRIIAPEARRPLKLRACFAMAPGFEKCAPQRDLGFVIARCSAGRRAKLFDDALLGARKRGQCQEQRGRGQDEESALIHFDPHRRRS